MSSVDEAVGLFEHKFSCAQAVLGGFCERFGVDRDDAIRLARGFGSGMGLGRTCGAVTGAMMVLGLFGGAFVSAENEAPMRQVAYDRIRAFVERFEAIHGSIRCQDLIGVDLSVAAGREEAKRRNLFTTICPAYVRDAARILEDLTGDGPASGRE